MAHGRRIPAAKRPAITRLYKLLLTHAEKAVNFGQARPMKFEMHLSGGQSHLALVAPCESMSTRLRRGRACTMCMRTIPMMEAEALEEWLLAIIRS